jgi:uncharacterized membrane protein (DUF106 family)
MRKLIVASVLVIASLAAQAQQPDLSAQVDAATAAITTAASNMRQQILLDQQRIAALQQQLDAHKAAADKPHATDHQAPTPHP